LIATSFNSLFIGKVQHHLDETPSTNAFAAELLAKGNVLEGTLVSASVQSKGRGYSGNSWESEKGKNLLFSIILKPTFLLARQQFYLNELVTLGIYDALLPESGSKLRIKWPNDIFYKDEKLAGILIENTLSGHFIQHSVIGIGLNVNQEKFADGIKHVTSLKKITKKDMDLNELLKTICEKIEVRYLQLKKNQLQFLQQDYMRTLYRADDEEYWYRKNGKKFKARIAGLSPEGKLMLATDKGWDAYGFKEVEFVL